MTWILLIYVFAGFGQGGTAVLSIPGYSSQKACMEASAAAPPPIPTNASHRVIAGCIPGPT